MCKLGANLERIFHLQTILNQVFFTCYAQNKCMPFQFYLMYLKLITFMETQNVVFTLST